MKLTSAQLDRAAGVLLGMACGDALGAGYEFGPPLASDAVVTMRGGGGFDWAPGEWTDDTSMAVPIVNAIAAGQDLRDEAVLDEIVAAWVEWARTAPDVGNQLRAVLSRTDPTASAVRVVARAHHDRHGRSGGNGSLMRTAPVALAYLDDPVALAGVARTISTLTHYETDAGDACVLWCLAIRHAVLEGTLDVRVGLDALPAERRALWEARFVVAEAGVPSDFSRNGWVVEALQAAWSAIIQPRSAPGGASGAGTVSATPAGHLQDALEIAVRGGRDTDTVAAIAGGLLGARYGASAVPAAWRRIVHGWPGGLRADELVRRGVLAARANGGRSRWSSVSGSPVLAERRDRASTDRNEPGAVKRRDVAVLDRRSRKDRAATTWPTADHLPYSTSGDISTFVRHPHDDGVWLGAIGILGDLPVEIDAVVSLCRVGRTQVPGRIRAENKVAVWLIDEPAEKANPNLDFVLTDTVDVIAALRAEGRTVLVHCVQAVSRTPAVGALYAARHRGIPIEQALREVTDVLPHAHPNTAFLQALKSEA
ncbi:MULTISPECIES: ADP-ribosylglycohydrolase family protein [unclassified Cryobacterium]|uniref:ADP-ribosylglycohydrolase family protein n=1 Tax=unclassified Cryobacterium TaxID=2649013 RepID=UPI001E2CA3ED|nr:MULTISPECIES: ADP-ribosylglycohydrolase family protein [unclassified Cryobacterium]